MTIDERLDRLTERHEALAQSVELFVAENRIVTENISKLYKIAELHERRLDNLEGDGE